MITSQFRIDFWIGKIMLLLGMLALMAFLFFLSHKNGEFDFRHVFFWAGVTIFAGFWAKLYRFMFGELKTIVVSEKGISIKYLLSNPDHINFDEIKKMEMYPVRSVGTSKRHNFVSHYELVISLRDGNTFCFDGYQYKNFGALKSMIYQYVYHEEP